MIDLTHPITLADFPHLYLYPDLEDSAHYYGYAQPHLALTEAATADLTLMTYQKGGRVTGGQLNLTTSLAMSEAERQAVVAAIAQETDTIPRLSYPDWTGGRVTVAIADGPTLTGQPSLLGANTCALSTSLSADQAQALSDLWQSRQDWLTLHYDLQLVGWDVATTEVTQTSDQPGCRTSQSHSVQQTTARTATRQLTCSLSPIDGKRVEIKL